MAAAEAVPPRQGRQAHRGLFRRRDHQHPLDAVRRRLSRRAELGEVARRRERALRPRRRERQGNRGLGRAHALGRFPRPRARDPLKHQRLSESGRSGRRRSDGRRAGRVRQVPRDIAGEGKGRVRHWRLSRRASWLADLVRCDGRDDRRRAADPLARLRLRPREEQTRQGRLTEALPPPQKARVQSRGLWTRSWMPAFPGMTQRNAFPVSSQRPRGAANPRSFAMSPRVLISDKLSPAAVAIFKERGVEVDVKPGLDKEEIAKIIGDYDGLAIRSNTKVTAKLLERATKLKVVGRAGIGVDNVDIPAATARGVIVMNTPFGNSITTAEHAIALMFALARQIPSADVSTQAGKWEKNRFMGVELTGKTLGIIGCGNIGAIVASRALGLKMRVVAFDPFLSAERAQEIGVEKLELSDLLARADFITLHTPLTAQTRNILSVENLAKTKPGVRIINCARGGLVDEAALRAALDSGLVSGAAFDVFIEEPATANPLFGHPNFIATPHLGASTNEAQENVALQVAEQMSDYLTRGAISNAINFPSITAEEAPKLKPFIALAEGLGSFAGQLTQAPIQKVTITYEGAVAELKIKALTSAAIAGLLRPSLVDINVVSAPTVAAQRGIVIEEMTRAADRDYESFITLTAETGQKTRAIGGNVFQDGKPRILLIKGIKVDAEFTPSMIYVTNEDKPGFIGRFASLLGDAGVNIATFALGRDEQGGSAIALVSIDGAAPPEVIAKVGKIDGVRQVAALRF